jgi:hypothetical protein
VNRRAPSDGYDVELPGTKLARRQGRFEPKARLTRFLLGRFPVGDDCVRSELLVNGVVAEDGNHDYIIESDVTAGAPK